MHLLSDQDVYRITVEQLKKWGFDEDVHRELHRVFMEHTEEELKHLFCVVEPHRHRIRHL